MRPNLRAVVFVAASLAFSVAWAGIFVDPGRYNASPNDLVVEFIDVGQGDSILISPPSGKRVLIDGGEGDIEGQGASRACEYLDKKGVENLHCVILTHPHPDHFAGLSSVFDGIKVRTYLDSGQTYKEADTEWLEMKAVSQGAAVRRLGSGSEIDLGGGAVIKVLSPEKGGTFESINDNSLVMKLEYGDTYVLFAADAQMEQENALAAKQRKNLSCDVLKVPHHGSYSSSSAGFITAAGPKAAVISCGHDNPFQHPHSSTLAKYKRRGIKVFRTDYGGTITFTTNGKEFKIETEK